MELFRKKNQATTIVFPLISSGSNSYYTTSAWSALTSKSVSAYSWNEGGTAPNVASIANTPTQLASTGIWYLSATAAEMNPNSGNDDYLAIKLKAGEIKEQTILVILTTYATQDLADSTNKVVASVIPQVQVSGINGGLYVGTSAYTNHPQVYVSAGNITNVTGNISGSVASVTGNVAGNVTGSVGSVTGAVGSVTAGVTVTTNNDKTGYSVTAQTNHPAVSVSGSTVSLSASVRDWLGTTPNVLQSGRVDSYVGFNNDKTNYTVSSGSITAVAGNVTGSVGSVTGAVGSVTAGVTVTTNNDKTNYSISAQTNHPAYPAMSVSAVTDKTGYSGVVTNDVSVSAYTNFPQVYVSAGQVTNVTGNVSGSVNNLVVNPTMTIGQVTVSAYNNFPKVTVSANEDKIDYSISGTKKLLDNLNDIDGTAVTVTSIPQVNVSAYTNFPSVNVSSVTNGSITSADFGVDYYNKIQSLDTIVTIGQVQVSGINGGLYVGTSAYTNFPQVVVSANLDKTNYTVSSGSITAVAGNITGSVRSVTNSVSVSAQTNHPVVSVSAYTNFPQVTVSANLDKTNYTVSSGSITAVAGNVTGSVGSVTGTVGSVTGGVTVTTNNDKTGYSVSAQTNHPIVTVSAYTNFPQVQVSSTTVSLSASVRDWLGTAPNVLQSGRVDSYVGVNNDKTGYSVTAQTNHPTVAVSAYTNFPQVYVSAGQVTNVTGNISGSVNNVVVPQSIGQVTVSAYNNFPKVQVSGIDAGIEVSATVTIDYAKVKDANVSAINETFTFSGSNVNAYSVNELSIGSVTVSAYTNFPQVYVSAGQVTNITGNVSGSVNSVISNVIVGSGTITNITNPVQVSAQTNHPIVSVSSTTIPLSADIRQWIGANPNVLQSGRVDSYVGNKGVLNDINGSSVTATSVTDKTGYSLGNSVIVSAFSNFPQVTVSANLDKTNYTVSSGSITAVAGNVTGSVNSVTNSVTVGTNNDKTGYVLSSTSEDSIVDKVWDEVIGGALHTTSGTAGYDVSLLPSIQSNINIAVAGVPNNYTASADQIIFGTRTAGNYSATWYEDGTYFQITTSGGNGLDINLLFNIGSSRASQITINGRFTAAGTRFVNVYSYNYVTNSYDQLSDSLTRMIHSNSDQNYSYNILSNNQSNNGDVKIRFLTTATNNGDDLYLDQVLVKGILAGATPSDIADAVYNKMSYTVYDGAIWIDTINGFSGTDIGINGLATHPVNNLNEAIIIAGIIGVKKFCISPKSSLILNQTFDSWIFEGRGWNLDLNNQNISNSTFYNARVIGNGLADDGYISHFSNCSIVGSNIKNLFLWNGSLESDITITSSSNHTLIGCIDATDINTTPTLLFQSSATLQIRDYHGGLLIKYMNSTNDCVIDGYGRVIIDSTCSGGTIAIRGNFSLIDNSSGLVTVTQDARYNISQPVGSVTAPITVSAYQNFPEVNVSSVNSGAITSSDYNVDFYNRSQLGLATSTSISNLQNTVNIISANTNTLITTPTSANIVWVNGVSVQLVDFKNTQTEIYTATSSAVSIELGNANIVTTTDLTNTSAAIVNHGDINWSSSATTDIAIISAGALAAIDERFTFSGSLVLSLASSATINVQEVVDAMLSTVVDGKTFEEVLEILISMAQGKITRTNNNFTYYKSDGTTALFTLQSNRSERDKL